HVGIETLCACLPDHRGPGECFLVRSEHSFDGPNPRSLGRGSGHPHCLRHHFPKSPHHLYPISRQGQVAHPDLLCDFVSWTHRSRRRRRWWNRLCRSLCWDCSRICLCKAAMAERKHLIRGSDSQGENRLPQMEIPEPENPGQRPRGNPVGRMEELSSRRSGVREFCPVSASPWIFESVYLS